MSKPRSRSLGDALLTSASYAFTTGFAVLCLVPFLYVLSHSLTPYSAYLQAPARLIPESLSIAAYREVLTVKLMRTGYLNTLFIVVVGTSLNIFLLLITAYPLTKPDLKGRNLLLSLYVFTMFFGGGMIPNYYVILKLGLLNSLWSLILPGAISTFNLLLMKSFISSTIPASLEESAVIDGASDVVVLFRIIAPLSLPALATFTVFCSVGHWNSFFHAVLYITSRSQWPLMLVLREVVVEDNSMLVMNQAIQNIVVGEEQTNPYTLKMATIVIATVPILMIYPFLQRFFVKGIMLGSIKG